MSTYGWVTDCGYSGPRDSPFTDQEIREKGTPFRLYDDDGLLCHTGKCLCPDQDESLFGPLDDFGAPHSGCTRIDYFMNNQWETI